MRWMRWERGYGLPTLLSAPHDPAMLTAGHVALLRCRKDIGCAGAVLRQ